MPAVIVKGRWYYWSVPDAAFDDPDEMARWVRLAREAAMRTAGSSQREGAARRPPLDEEI